MASRPPDISERVVIDLSGRTSAYYDPTTYKFDVAIGGMPFIYGITDATPYRRQTAEFRTQRFDNARDPGEQSLSGSGYWIRSQSSFHLGGGGGGAGGNSTGSTARSSGKGGDGVALIFY